MLAHPAHTIALGLGSGLAPKAPGTVGSLWGWLSWLVVQNYLSLPEQALLITTAFLAGWMIGELKIGRRMNGNGYTSL